LDTSFPVPFHKKSFHPGEKVETSIVNDGLSKQFPFASHWLFLFSKVVFAGAGVASALAHKIPPTKKEITKKILKISFFIKIYLKIFLK